MSTTTLSPVAAIVQRCETLFEDLEFKAVQQWKDAKPGRKAIGLVQTVFDDPELAALTYFNEHLAGKSASSMACAVLAARGAMLRDVRHRLAEVERLYLDRLMQTRDANEGLVAFLAKRKPHWEHH